MACRDDDSARPANCFARGFARPTGDNHKWHRHRKYRVPRLHRRLPTRANVYSGLHGFVLLAWTALDAVSLPCSSSLWNKTRNAGAHHCIQPLSDLNSLDFVGCVFWKARDVEILSGASRSPGMVSKAEPRCTA